MSDRSVCLDHGSGTEGSCFDKTPFRSLGFKLGKGSNVVIPAQGCNMTRTRPIYSNLLYRFKIDPPPQTLAVRCEVTKTDNHPSISHVICVFPTPR